MCSFHECVIYQLYNGKATLNKLIVVKNDCFSIVYLTAMEKQTLTVHVGFSILCKNRNYSQLIAAYCPGRRVVGQHFDFNFICATIEIMNVLVFRTKKCSFLLVLSLFVDFHMYITH